MLYGRWEKTDVLLTVKPFTIVFEEVDEIGKCKDPN